MRANGRFAPQAAVQKPEISAVVYGVVDKYLAKLRRIVPSEPKPKRRENRITETRPAEQVENRSPHDWESMPRGGSALGEIQDPEQIALEL